MRIVVEVSEWEQACCGTAFAVGDAVTWNLFAADPAKTPPGAPPRYVEEHHDQTPQDVPQSDVTGTVRAIIGVTYPAKVITGEPRSFTLDTEHPTHTPLTEVGVPPAFSTEEDGGTPFSSYLVEVDVAEECDLPGFVASEADREYRASLRTRAARSRERSTDPVGVALEAAADYAQATFGSVAHIVRDTDRSAVTIEPHRSGGTPVWWARSDEDVDGIGIHTGEGSWWLEASVENAGLTRVFLDAAAAGRVTEAVVDRGGAAKRLDTIVRSEDGRTWTASTDVDPVITGADTMVVVGDAWERVERGRRTYLPWGTPQ